MEPNDSVGDRLREERLRLELKQEQVASAAALAGVKGATRQSQSLYEKSERSPDAAYLGVAAKLGIDVRYVITGSRDYDPPAPLTAEEQTLLSYWRQASSDTRKAALGALVGAKPVTRSRVQIGEVGQHVHGDLHLQAQTINMGGKKR